MKKVKETFIRSSARHHQYINHLKFYGITQPQKIPLPYKTQWNSWFKMILYTKDYLTYWLSFFQAEIELEKNKTEALSIITNFLSNA